MVHPGRGHEESVNPLAEGSPDSVSGKGEGRVEDFVALVPSR